MDNLKPEDLETDSDGYRADGRQDCDHERDYDSDFSDLDSEDFDKDLRKTSIDRPYEVDCRTHLCSEAVKKGSVFSVYTVLYFVQGMRLLCCF